jgi:hypothetical protein
MTKLDYSQIDKAIGVLGLVVRSGMQSPSTSERWLFFFAQSVEGWRVARTFRSLVELCCSDPNNSIEATEVIARQCFERALVVQYTHQLKGDNPYWSFIKTSDLSMSKSWGEEYAPKEIERSVDQLPSYTEMCMRICPDGTLKRQYSQLSHIAHPKLSFPSFTAESLHESQKHGSGHGLRLKRAVTAINAVHYSVHAILEVAQSEVMRTAGAKKQDDTKAQLNSLKNVNK